MVCVVCQWIAEHPEDWDQWAVELAWKGHCDICHANYDTGRIIKFILWDAKLWDGAYHIFRPLEEMYCPECLRSFQIHRILCAEPIEISQELKALKHHGDDDGI